MESFLQNLDKNLTPQINEITSKIKDYVQKYSLIPILEIAFINDNFIFDKEGVPNEDQKLASYIGDLFLTFQQNKSFQQPTDEQAKEFFELCLELHKLCMMKDMLMDMNPEIGINPLAMFQYTERSFYTQIYCQIFDDIMDLRFIEYFNAKCGFPIQDVFLFNLLYKGFVYDKYQNKNEGLLKFSIEELYAYFKNFFPHDNDYTAIRLKSFVEYFLLSESNNFDCIPRADNPVLRKPFLKYNDKYICCDSLKLIKDFLPIFENELKKDEKLFTEYGSVKGELFENAVAKLFKNFFPYATFYQGLQYYLEDKKRYEVDLIVDTGQFLLIVESKGRTFQDKGKQGNKGSYDRSIKNLIAEAHEQCIRTYEYITSSDFCVFKNGKEEVSFSKDNYLDIYLVTLEIENLDSITSDIYETLNVYEKNPVQTFSLYDFYIIQDILQKGSVFLNYLEQRRGSLKEKKIHSATELDYLCYYINNGMFYDKQNEITKGTFDNIQIGNFSDELDKYYLQGKKKPAFPIVTGGNILCQQISNYDKSFGLTFEKEFLSAAPQTQKNILNKIKDLQKQATKGKSSVFSYTLESNHMGISFICFKNEKFILSDEELQNYVDNKMKTLYMKHWSFIIFTLKPNKVVRIVYK